MEGYRRFLALLASAVLVGLVSVILSFVWVLHYRGGLSWDGSSAEFNWHPVLITMGFVFLQGIGASGARVGAELRGSRVCLGPGRRGRGGGAREAPGGAAGAARGR